jgi:hypothetical protein
MDVLSYAGRSLGMEWSTLRKLLLGPTGVQHRRSGLELELSS